ncbi:hypothetical protein SAMN05216276_104378 [Streptosporangium subroseum]|uniref:Uncharacterized protein n=1 Tax=Streptosporangium subroseum TaxID=106412 RepID=A0A239MNU4_9ACTN|nr:hypothetical protein SAMN05216276_104378 [Streptosporangium subroseum]
MKAGEVYRITRNGIEVAERRPPSHGCLTAEDLTARHRRLPRVDHELMRQESDEPFDAKKHIFGRLPLLYQYGRVSISCIP